MAAVTTFTPPQLTRSPLFLLKTVIAAIAGTDLHSEVDVSFDEESQWSFLADKLASTLIWFFASLRTLTGAIWLIANHCMDEETMLWFTSRCPAPLYKTINIRILKLTHLKGLPLAHLVSTQENFKISLLLDANIYWDLVE